jgi:hypothetical protein
MEYRPVTPAVISARNVARAFRAREGRRLAPDEPGA